MQWFGDTLIDVETAANTKARRWPTDRTARKARLKMRALLVSQNGDPDETEVFSHELLVYDEPERSGR